MDSADSDDDTLPVAVPLDDAHADKPAPEQPKKPVPVTLITGFLGAGKSTLVRHILTAQHGRRIAVIVNEFGEELGIERAIVNENDGSEETAVNNWLELANGCVCCTMKSQLVAGLEGMLEQRHRFDYILIETSGLANPGPVATALWTDAELEAGVTLDGIVTVADARHLPRQLAAAPTAAADDANSSSSANEAQQQIAYSDVVLLNKVDLEGEEQLAAVEAAIAAINPTARRLRTHRCDVDVGAILDLRALAGDRALGLGDQAQPGSTADDAAAGAQPPAGDASTEAQQQADGSPDAHLRGSQARPSGAQAHSHSAGGSAADGGDGQHAHDHHHLHADQVTSVSLRLSGPLDLQRVRQWAEALLWDRQADGPDVFRMKGVLDVAGNTRQHLLQAVHELYEVTEGADWGGGSKRGTRIVVIGCRLQRLQLERDLQQCLA